MSDDQKNRQSLLLPILFPVAILALIAVVLLGFSRVLLHVTPHAATIVALITASGIFAVAALVASRERLSGAALFPMIGAIAGIALLASGLALVAAPKVEETGTAAETVLLGAPINAAVEGFKPTVLSFKADTPTNLQFNDEDPTAPHNVVIFEGKDATGKQVFEGDLVNGPKQVVYKVPALPAGSYFFHCAVHPTTMMGNITVSSTGGGGGGTNGGGGGAPTLAASNLTYSTDQLSWAADTPTTLTFDNQDAGVPHNFSIYSDDAYTDNVFKGDLVTGPATQEYQIPALAAGTYFYRCDVHPTMKGTLTVGAGSGTGGGSSGSATPGASGSVATPTASPSG